MIIPLHERGWVYGGSYWAFSLFSFKQPLAIIASTDLIPIKIQWLQTQGQLGALVMFVFSPRALEQRRVETSGSKLSLAFQDNQGYRKWLHLKNQNRERGKKKKAGQAWWHTPFITALEQRLADWVQRPAWSTQWVKSHPELQSETLFLKRQTDYKSEIP